MKRIFFYMVLALIFSACGSNNKENTTENIAENETTIREKAPQTKWKYEENTNAMDDSKTYFASLEANEVMKFDFPYEGGVKIQLYLRNMSKKNEVFLVISQGQFISSILGNKSILVRFDKNKAEKYNYIMPSDGSSETIFITQQSKFIKKLKQSQKLTVQCEFFNEGRRTLTFNTKGLDWEH